MRVLNFLNARTGKAVAVVAALATVVALAPWSASAASAAAPAVPDGGGHMQGGDAPSLRMTPMTPNATPSGSVASYSVKGIDVASYQQNVDWTSVRNAGYRFALVKATEGTTYTNTYFSSQYNGAKAAGLYTGAYAFARPDLNNPVQQAQYFLKTIRYYPDGLTLPPMLDLEGPYPGLSTTDRCWGLTPAQIVSWTQSFVNTVVAATGQPMIIYTGAYWWNDCAHSSQLLAGQLLDIPAWQSTSPTYLPAGFSSWTFWQYTSTGSVPGVPGTNVDQNAFYGNLQQLAHLAQPALAPGTSPSIAALKGGGYVVAYQGVNGTLITLGTPGFHSWNLGMMPKTSPAVAALSNGGYEVAFQANTGMLWTAGTWWTGNWHIGMAPGTSPAITGLTSGGYEVAFQSNAGYLWSAGSWWTGNWALGMAPGTSPAIAGLSTGGYEMAFQANTGILWSAGSWWTGAWNLGMDRGSSPAIAALKSGYQMAFQANTHVLWSAGSAGKRKWNLGMAPGTNPAITGLSTGGFEMAFQANTGILWSAGSWWTGKWNLGMAPATSPSISGLTTRGYQMVLQANTGVVWTAGSLGTGTAT